MVNNRNNDVANSRNYPVDTDLRINRQFDNIAYNKAGSIMLMIRALIGDKLWTDGLVNYLNTRKFQTATWDQLLVFWDDVVKGASDEHLLNLEGRTITEIFEPYFLQMGVPALIVALNGNKLSIKTDRFLSRKVSDKAWPKSSFEYKWDIPLVVKYPSGHKIHWLKDAGLTEQTYEIDLEDSEFVLDPEANIWCRMNFDMIYINRMVQNKDQLTPRHITKVMQDQYQMLTSDYADQYQVSSLPRTKYYSEPFLRLFFRATSQVFLS